MPWQRTINTTWDTILRNPLTRVTLDASDSPVTQSSWTYNSRGQTTARCEVDPAIAGATGYTCGSATQAPAGVRQWTYTYCDAVDDTQCPLVGLLLNEDGPRTDVSDVTTYAYYLADSSIAHHGDLKSVTDALGHATTYLAYDGAGRILSQQDANGTATTLTYTPRGWLHTRTVDGATTSYTYTPYGAIAAVTDPDGVTVTYGYDDAHRLTDVTDAQGNHIHYTLDAAGNRIAENTYATGSSTTSRTLTRTYNAQDRLTKVIDGLNHTVFDASDEGSTTSLPSYDNQGNLLHSTDALGVVQERYYDELNRLWDMYDDGSALSPDTANTAIHFTYDALDRLTEVIDPDYANTTYDHDGLGNPTGQTSPDTGTTTRSFDAAGNVLTQTDAKGIITTYAYDTLNRLTAVSYPDSTQNVTYHYDEADSVTGCSSSYPLGRLTRVVEGTGGTAYCYDARGNVVRKRQTYAGHTDNTYYAYSAADRLIRLQYPSGSHLVYTRDGDGRIASLRVNLRPNSYPRFLSITNGRLVGAFECPLICQPPPRSLPIRALKNVHVAVSVRWRNSVC